MKEKRTQWIRVPAGTAFKTCRSPNCQKRIYFAVNPGSGRAHPVDCDVPGGVHPSAHRGEALPSLFGDAIEAQDGQGVSHFETCIDADTFRSGAH